MSALLTGAVRSHSVSGEDTRLARESGEALAGLISDVADRITLKVEDERTGRHTEATVPAAAMRLLAEALSEMAAGHAVTLVPLGTELSTQQAARLLGVSRPYFIKLLEQGEIPYRKVGEQRRISYRDLLAYIEFYQHEATSAMDKIAADAQRLRLP